MNDQDTSPPLWLELAAALLVPAACVGFLRVFDTSDVLYPILGASLLSSAVAIVARRLGLNLAVTGLVSIALLVVLLMQRYTPGTAALGIIPTGATVDATRALIDGLVDNFRELESPVPPLAPFVAASMAAAWLMAFLTDWGAMRLRLAFEPVLPAGLVFLFTSVPPISAGGNALIPSAAIGSAVAFWAVCQRSAFVSQRGIWLPGHGRPGTWAVGTVGAVFAAVAVISGLVLGPRLPGAEAEPVYSFKEQVDPARKVISPYVNLRNRLVSQTNEEMFTVTADTRSYWRIAGLDTYSGGIWQVAGDFSRETGVLPGRRTYPIASAPNTQEFAISGLAAIWLPAAYAPSEIITASTEVTWNAESSSLTVAQGIETSDGSEYGIISQTATIEAADLSTSGDAVDPEIAERYLALPGDLSPRVQSLALEITAGASSRYDKALALQNHFQSYDYSVDLSERVGDPVEQFLDERRGFCQQFAGTYALMARSIGIPARVATGFTWGDPIGTDPVTGRTTYRVTGRHTHAWPEVFFEDVGWVAFEPTPGRGNPAATNYSQQPAQQDSPVEAEPPPTPTPTTTPTPGQTAPAPQLPEEPELEPATDSDGFSFNLPWRWLGLLAVALAYVIGLPQLLRWRAGRRRQRAATEAERVSVAWLEANEALELGLDLAPNQHETRSEFAGRLGGDARLPGPALDRLAALGTAAQFHPQGVRASQADEADEASASIVKAVRDHVPTSTWYLRQLDPRRAFATLRRPLTITPVIKPTPDQDRAGGSGSGEDADTADQPGEFVNSP
jgi:transglutaminase-like putative cysteine protease